MAFSCICAPTDLILSFTITVNFRALLYGGMRESQPQAEIFLQDTTPEAFSMLIKYIYTGRASLREEKEEVLLDFLSLAHKYGFPELEDSTSEYLCTILKIQNVSLIYDAASLYSLGKLSSTCCLFMDRNAQEVLSSEGFLSLSKSALLDIVQRDSFAAPEKDIFKALMRWCRHNPKENHSEIMAAIRLPLMSLTELLNVVRPSALLSPDAILDAIKVRSESRDMDLNYRGMLIPEENIATMKYGAQVVKGELKSALLDGDTQNYDLDHGFSRHPIEDDCRSGLEVKLGQPSIINHVRLLLWDRDSRSYSYYIEVSMDELDWIRVIDHSNFYCRSWQKLYFPARVCRYIRIVGTHNTVNKVFHLVAFECMFTHKSFTLEKGLLGKKQDGESSPMLLLWDCDDRSYSYYIEVSTNQQQWTMVADRTKVPCRSWQTITFDRQPTCFIRIVGTHNTANEVFHCVHFECPAQTISQKEESCEENPSGDPPHSPHQGITIALRASAASSPTHQNNRGSSQ
uniref:BTB/POZ domain-containing protein 9 n=1 Tax=Pyxicephalus adspersus TaxID=30357 RepID=A0AAV3AHX7_PYXAD|nr:TPA: hypothetical protein GDO54_011529 [Pyxicephalus adspersus]